MSEKLEALAVTQADREAAQALWAAMQSQGPIVEAEGGRAIGRAMLQAFSRHRLAHSTPANGEQVERVARALAKECRRVENTDLDWEDYTGEARAAIAAMEPTPTQDARERVKGLEEAEEALQYLEGFPSDPREVEGRITALGSSRLDAAIRTLRTALGNQEERL